MHFKLALPFFASLCFIPTQSRSSQVKQSRSSQVIQLKSDTFDLDISTGVWFVKFYAPWCQHCQKLEPTIKKLSSEVFVKDEDVYVAKVDCTAEVELCERFGIMSYPTLKLISNGESREYTGKLNVDAMYHYIYEDHKFDEAEKVISHADFVRKKTEIAKAQEEAELKSSVIVITTDTFEKLVQQSSDTWIIKFYAPWCAHCRRLAPIWNELSVALKEEGIGVKVGKVDCTVSRRVCSRFGVNGYPTLLFVRDGKVYKYEGSRTTSGLVDFVTNGHKTAKDSGPIPNEKLLTKIVDGFLEAEHSLTNMVLMFLVLVCIASFFVVLYVFSFEVSESTASQTSKRATAAGGKPFDKAKAE